MNSAYVTEANKVSSAGAWVWLLEIISTGYSTLRYTNNNDNVVWNGNTYTRMPFRFNDVKVSTDGVFPEYKLEIAEVSLTGAILSRVHDTDGLPRSLVRLMLVHSDHLAVTTPAVEEYAEILSVELTTGVIVLNVGIPSLLNRRFPRDRYVPSYCRHMFGGALCQYVQPSYSITSNSVQFVELEGYTPSVNRIVVNDVDLRVELFAHALPVGGLSGATWALVKDTGFTITGTPSNDGFYLAENYYGVSAHHVYVKKPSESGRAFIEETVTSDVVIQLGYSACNHTLDACKFRDNSQNFGGSPGIAGGVYG